MPTYFYLSVSIPAVSRRYSYISDDGPLPIGTHVAVPFGKENDVVIGTVEACAEYTRDGAPYPPERTKHILRVIPPEEYAALSREAAADMDELDEEIGEELELADDMMEEEELDDLFEWALHHHDSTVRAIQEKVVECYELLVSHGHPIAALNLGTFYYTGRVVPQDYVKAYTLYRFAAQAGEVRAMCNLGYCYYYGRHQAVDYAEAYRWFSAGALLEDDANCLYKLGDMYLNGYSVEKNERYAFRLYVRAMRRCNEDEESRCLADVQFRVGRCLLYGIGVDRDVEAAHAQLSLSLLNFYRRRNTDKFVKGLIDSAKALIREAQEALDAETDANGRDGT